MLLTRNTWDSTVAPVHCPVDGQIAPDGSQLLALERSGRLIKLDYPCFPRRRDWNPSKSKVFALINEGSARYSALLEEFTCFGRFFESIAIHPQPKQELSPAWLNGWFPGMDAISLYGLIAMSNPRQYVEVGSGNSTMFARQAIKDHGLRTKIISIDPYPRASIDSICDQIIRTPCEEVPSDFFESLESDDILFVDNSHRAFQNSDVTVFFSEILPGLPRGLIYGLHDIFLPWDYPGEWKDRFYSEQYLLSAYLLGGANGDRIVLPNAFITYHSPHLIGSLGAMLSQRLFDPIEKTGTAFWLQKA